ncbi:MAG: hypothetical protein ACI3ZN_05860, partial [Candidatus Cryptobacteroides sp.]
MNLSYYIARRIKFKGVLSVVSIAVSYMVMIIAVAVSSGFRNEIRNGIAEISGDVQILPIGLTIAGEGQPISLDAAYLPDIKNIDGVSEIVPAIYRTGIVRNDGTIQGAVFKGVPSDSDNPLSASVPRRLSDVSGIDVGDKMTVYFVGEKIKVRNFTVTDIYDGLLDSEDKLVVKVPMEGLQRLNGWDSLSVSAFEVNLDRNSRSVASMREIASEISSVIYEKASEDD